MKLFINVPYAEKDEAKALGARWDPRMKRWFCDSEPEGYLKFSKWLLRDSDSMTIAFDRIFLVEGEQTCWKCSKKTRVVGAGVGKTVQISGEPDEPPYLCVDADDELHLAWSQDEGDFPPLILRYLKDHYSVRTGYSKTQGSHCFANHCDNCHALQGNYHLFEEVDSPLSSFARDEDQIRERMSRLRIMSIRISDALPLQWSVSLCTADGAYLAYGKVEELSLSESANVSGATFEELYGVQIS